MEFFCRFNFEYDDIVWLRLVFKLRGTWSGELAAATAALIRELVNELDRVLAFTGEGYGWDRILGS